jgi:hypothetical protein
MATDVWVNDKPLEDYGVVVTRLSGWWSTAARSYEAIPIPGRAGAWLSDFGGALGPRSLSIGLRTTGTTMTARRGILATLYEACRGTLEVRTNDDPTRFSFAVLSQASGIALDPALLEPRLDVQLELVAHDPYFYAVVPSVAAIPVGLRRSMATGTAPHGGVVRLAGPGTNPCVFTVRDRGGTVRHTMTLATTWSSAEYVELDLDQWTILRWNGATSTNFLEFLGTTETFAAFDPSDGPVAEVSGCAGATLTYRKADLT